MIHRDVLGTIGDTPMVELARIGRGLPGRIVAKLEMRNPCASVKDRLGLALIEDAERRGDLKPGGTAMRRRPRRRAPRPRPGGAGARQDIANKR